MEKAEKEEKEEKEESEAKKTKTQNLGIKPDSTPKIGDAFRRMTKVELYGKKQTQYDKKLLDFLACQFIPFGVVDSEEFKNCASVFSRWKCGDCQESVSQSREGGRLGHCRMQFVAAQRHGHEKVITLLTL